MDVAEDERNAGLVELHELRGATLIQSEIEAFAVEQRKDIVKKRIAVGKLDLPARRDHEQRRLETFISLHELRKRRSLLRCRRHRSTPERREPHHNLRSVRNVAPVFCELHLPLQLHALEFNILRRADKRKSTRQQHDAPDNPAMKKASHVQNSIPKAR